MKRIRLNENDIENLVKRILKEEGESQWPIHVYSQLTYEGFPINNEALKTLITNNLDMGLNPREVTTEISLHDRQGVGIEDEEESDSIVEIMMFVTWVDDEGEYQEQWLEIPIEEYYNLLSFKDIY